MTREKQVTVGEKELQRIREHEKEMKKKSEYIERPDLTQVRTWRDYRDNQVHREYYNRNGVIKEEIILFNQSKEGNSTIELPKKTEKK